MAELAEELEVAARAAADLEQTAGLRQLEALEQPPDRRPPAAVPPVMALEIGHEVVSVWFASKAC